MGKTKRQVGRVVKLSQVRNKLSLLVFALAFALIATIVLVTIHAATPIVSFEAENATLSGNATLISGPNQSNGKAVRFNAASSGSCVVTAILVNPCRAWLGASADNYTGTVNGKACDADDKECQILLQEQRIGRQVDIAHTYHSPGNNTLTSIDKFFIERPNTILYMNWKPPGNWGDITNQTAAIDQIATSIKTESAHKIMVTLWHEPENDESPGGDPNCPNTDYTGNAGTAAQYRAMWQFVVNRFRSDGVTNVVWAIDYVNLTKFDCLRPALYPGNSLVDWVMFNGYEHIAQPSFSESVGHIYNLLTSQTTTSVDFTSKPWGIIEWGVSSDNHFSDAQEQDFYRGAKQVLDADTYPRLKAYVIFDENGQGKASGPNFRVGYHDNGTLDPTKQALYNAFANDPKLTGSWSGN